MRDLTDIFKLLSDEHRLRVLMLLEKKELSVCQLMGIIGISQPLISRNISMLYAGRFLDERRQGKLRFYSIRRDLDPVRKAVLRLLREIVRQSAKYKEDLSTLKECSDFQKKAGRCDMETLSQFMKQRKRK